MNLQPQKQVVTVHAVSRRRLCSLGFFFSRNLYIIIIIIIIIIILKR